MEDSINVSTINNLDHEEIAQEVEALAQKEMEQYGNAGSVYLQLPLLMMS
jgi:hypothetical protein